MNWDNKPVDIQFLVDSGLLFQINRMILHPFGLALSFSKKEDGELELNVKDMRHQPDQATFSKEVFDKAADKYERFTLEHGFELMNKRQRKLGYTTQPWSRKRF